jgi:hypothetical protein
VCYNLRGDKPFNGDSHALEAARRALTIVPKLKQLLRTTCDPNDPAKLRGEENDLEVFFEDAELRQIFRFADDVIMNGSSVGQRKVALMVISQKLKREGGP